MTSVESICQSNDESQLNISEGNLTLFALENIPRSRTKHSSCLSFGHLYVFGGRDGTVGLKDSWRYNIERHSWEKLVFKGNQLPYLEGHSSIAIDDKIIIFGGNFENDLSSPLWFFNVNDFSCSSIFIEDAMVPLSRRGHTACSYGKDMYVFGGFLDFFGCTDELWRLSSIHTKTPKWELLYNGQNVSKSFSQKNTRLSPDGWKSTQASFIEGFAQTSGAGPSPRSYHASAILRDDMFVHGGERGQKILASFWRWNFSSGSWLHLKSKPSPPPLKRHSMVAAGQTTLLVLGGETSHASGDFVFWGFNVNTSSWFKLQDPTSDNFKMDLVGFVSLNVSEVDDSDDGLSLVTLWSDTASLGNITEITDFSCSGVLSNFCHEDFDVPCQSTWEPPQFLDEVKCFLEGHREAARKLSSHEPADYASAFSSPLHVKTSFSNDIEMDNLNDSRDLLKRGSDSEKPLSFDNDCFDFDESNDRRDGPALPTSDEMSKTCRSPGPDLGHDGSSAPYSQKLKKEKKCHLLALVGGKKKSRQKLAVSPLSVILLSCDQVTCKINSIIFY